MIFLRWLWANRNEPMTALSFSASLVIAWLLLASWLAGLLMGGSL